MSRWRCNMWIIYESDVTGSSANFSLISDSCTTFEIEIKKKIQNTGLVRCATDHYRSECTRAGASNLHVPAIVQSPMKVNRIHDHRAAVLYQSMWWPMLNYPLWCRPPVSCRCHFPIFSPVFATLKLLQEKTMRIIFAISCGTTRTPPYHFGFIALLPSNLCYILPFQSAVAIVVDYSLCLSTFDSIYLVEQNDIYNKQKCFVVIFGLFLFAVCGLNFYCKYCVGKCQISP